jgi:hypothetical protein
MPSQTLDTRFSQSTLRKPMQLVDPHTGMMQCRVCGSVHCANTKHGGGFSRGSWQCCNSSCPTNHKVWDVERQRWVRQ